MNLWAAVASTIAAATGILALRFGSVEAKRRRLTGIIDLITDVKVAIDWGPSAALRRDELQGRLRTRIGGLALPKTRELANAKLRAETEFSDLAADALAEARVQLEDLHVLPLRSGDKEP